MDLFKEFEADKKALPVILLVDTSGSMSGIMNVVNESINKMIETLSNENNVGMIYKLSIITFGGNAKTVLVNKNIKDVEVFNFSAGGRTPFGSASKLLKELLEDKKIFPSKKTFAPAIFLITDGYPTDEYENNLKELCISKRFKKSDRFAIDITNNTDAQPSVKVFVGEEGRYIHTSKINEIEEYFKFVTLCTLSKSKSKSSTKKVENIEVERAKKSANITTEFERINDIETFIDSLDFIIGDEDE